jgi:hypothetical protein
MGLPVVVMSGVNAEDVLELTTTDDQQAVEALTADAADPALHMGVRVWRLHRRAEIAAPIDALFCCIGGGASAVASIRPPQPKRQRHTAPRASHFPHQATRAAIAR